MIQMKNRKQSFFKKIGKVLPKIIGKDIKKKNSLELSIINNWKEIVEGDIAKFCYPIKIKFSSKEGLNGTIFLKIKRGRSMEIEFRNEEIIEKLNQYFGYKAIDKISIMQDFNFETTSEKNKPIKKRLRIGESEIKIIDKIKRNDVKIALKKLNKTLLEG